MGNISLHEVRSLGELNVLISDRSFSWALIEAAPTNLDEVLAWMAESMRSNRHVKAVAMLDTALADLGRGGPLVNRGARQDVENALREAGAMEVVHSPRHLRDLTKLGLRYASGNMFEIANQRSSRPGLIPHAQPRLGRSFDSWAWGLLPWQDAQLPLR